MNKELLDDSILNDDPWAENHQRGKRAYIIYDGILGFGLTMAIVMTFTDVLFREGAWADFLTQVGLNFIMWPIGGLCYGWIMWKYMEGRYQKRLERRQNRQYERWA